MHTACASNVLIRKVYKRLPSCLKRVTNNNDNLISLKYYCCLEASGGSTKKEATLLFNARLYATFDTLSLYYGLLWW